MKRIISNTEYHLGSLLILIALVIFAEAINSEVVLYVTGFLYLIFVIKFVTYRFKAGIGLPSKCKMNSQGFIEVHVEKDSDGKIENALRILCEAIEIGKNEKKDILIDTWLISQRNTKDYLGESVEFVSSSFVQKIANKIHRSIYKAKHKNNIKSYRCIIRTSLVSREQMIRIQNKITQIDSRSKRIG
jgi:hypothetical protein